MEKGNNNHVGNFAIDFESGGTSALSALSHPEVFPEIPLAADAKKTIKALSLGDKWPICIFTLGVKTALDPQFDAVPVSNRGTRNKGRTMLRFNPGTTNHDLLKLQSDIVLASPLQVGMRRINSLADLGVESDAKGLGYYGAEYGSAKGVSYVISHSVPTAPIHSLGALQNALPEGKPLGVDAELSSLLQPSIQHAISNSFAPSVFSPSETESTIAGQPAADHSYLANLALWDDWFFSSISPESAPAYKDSVAAYSEQETLLKSFLSSSEKLPNSRFIPAAYNPKDTITKIFTASKPAGEAHLHTAALMMVDGAFNVNSTSVPAWKAFIAGLKGEEVPIRQTPQTPDTPELVKITDTPVPGLLIPGGKEIPANTLNDPKNPEQWTGFRSLTDDQIGELATAIVKQVRLRGPFTSLADFVNRRPGSNKDLALSGALQSALDDLSVSINEGFRTGERALSINDAAGFKFPEAEAGAKSVGAPGYVRQADLLTPLGPLISVRGDTFLIRAYGESRDKTGKVLARAWCEATVRRVPGYVDPTDEPHIANPTSDSNKLFGRKFETISFRFLNPAEIL